MEETLTPKRREIAGLSTLEFEAPAGSPTVVLFHGYGADGADLAPLAFELDLPRPARWLFPDAPLAMGEFGGRAWFPIDAVDIDRAQRAGRSIDWSERDPEGLGAASDQVLAFLAEVGAPWSSLVLGGFSQGSMLALDIALRAPENVRGLALLSGNLIKQSKWRELAKKRKGLPFFQSHGIADPILGLSGALKLETLLKEAGLAGSMLKFEGGHAIPPEVLAGLRDFLAKLI